MSTTGRAPGAREPCPTCSGGVRRVGEGQPGAPWPDLDRFLRGQGQRDRGYEVCTKNMITKGGAPSEVCFYKRDVFAIVRTFPHADFRIRRKVAVCFVSTAVTTNCSANSVRPDPHTVGPLSFETQRYTQQESDPSSRRTVRTKEPDPSDQRRNARR